MPEPRQLSAGTSHFFNCMGKGQQSASGVPLNRQHRQSATAVRKWPRGPNGKSRRLSEAQKTARCALLPRARLKRRLRFATSCNQRTPIVDNRARAAALEAILQASLQDDVGRKMRDNNPGKGFEFFLPLANMQAYQAKLLEVTQANMQFAFEFIQRLATIRSPFEVWAVIAEFTGRRILMIGKHSKELAAFWRSDAIRDLTALPGR